MGELETQILFIFLSSRHCQGSLSIFSVDIGGEVGGYQCTTATQLLYILYTKLDKTETEET